MRFEEFQNLRCIKQSNFPSNYGEEVVYKVNRVKNSFDQETLQTIISFLVFSKTLYCSTVWSNTSASNIKKLQSIQNFACKIVTGSKKYDHLTPLLQQLNCLPLKQLLKLKDSLLAF